MTHNRFFLWALVVLLALTTACTESDIPQTELPQEPAKPHTYRLSLDMPVPSFDGKTTRGTTEWEDGSEVEFFFYTWRERYNILDASSIGHDASDVVTRGIGPFYYDGISCIASYNAVKNEWLLTPQEDFPSPSDMNMNDCEVRYYQPQTAIDNEYSTAVYYGTTSYSLSLDGDQISCGSISLKPTNWRLRFQGEKGAQFQLISGDIKHDTGTALYMPFEALDWGEEDTLSLTVAADGYTPYIYGTFKNDGDNTITIETGGQKYTRTISSDALQPGETGYIVIPTDSTYEAEGWTTESYTIVSSPSKKEIVMESSDAKENITIESNENWTAKSDSPDWCVVALNYDDGRYLEPNYVTGTFWVYDDGMANPYDSGISISSPVEGNGNGSISVFVTENTTNVDREAYITIAGTKSQQSTTVTVFQKKGTQQTTIDITPFDGDENWD